MCVCAHPPQQACRLARTHVRTHARIHTRTAPYKQDKRATYAVGHHNHLDISGDLIAVVHILNSVWQGFGPRILPQAFEDPVGALGVIGNLPAHRVQCAWPSTHVGTCMASNVKKCASHQTLHKTVVELVLKRCRLTSVEHDACCTLMPTLVHIHGKHVSLAQPTREKNAPCNSTPARVGLERVVGFEPANTLRDQSD